MDAATILLIALGLATDAFAVSIARGMVTRNRRTTTGLAMASAFGAFQTFMPVLGWLAGLSLIELISNFDHWLAFGLLAFVGGKMIHSAKADQEKKKESPLTAATLLMLSVATSIDALAVGLSFSLLRVAIAVPVITIGVVTFLLSIGGFCFGSKLGNAFESKIHIVGGIVLIAIGVKILLEHLLI